MFERSIDFLLQQKSFSIDRRNRILSVEILKLLDVLKQLTNRKELDCKMIRRKKMKIEQE